MIVTELAKFAHSLQYEQLPPEVVTKAKTCVLDLLGISVCSYGHANSIVATKGAVAIHARLSTQFHVQLFWRCRRCGPDDGPVACAIRGRAGLRRRRLWWRAADVGRRRTGEIIDLIGNMEQLDGMEPVTKRLTPKPRLL